MTPNSDTTPTRQGSVSGRSGSIRRFGDQQQLGLARWPKQKPTRFRGGRVAESGC